MPVLGERKTKKIILPSSTKEDEAWVIINPDMTVSDVMDAKSENNKDRTYEMMTKVIVEWNFTDKDKNPMPINVETVKLLFMSDMLAIQSQLNIPEEALSDLKKKGLSFT